MVNKGSRSIFLGDKSTKKRNKSKQKIENVIKRIKCLCVLIDQFTLSNTIQLFLQRSKLVKLQSDL